MKVLYAAAEATPFIKVGGLGDVMGGLPKALCELGVDARVILPLYSKIKDKYISILYNEKSRKMLHLNIRFVHYYLRFYVYYNFTSLFL